jgi:antitoxin component of MazEF toxin-antitoxin module
MENKSFTITKKIAKHGNQAVIIIPTMLQEQLPHRSLVEVRIEVIE